MIIWWMEPHKLGECSSSCWQFLVCIVMREWIGWFLLPFITFLQTYTDFDSFNSWTYMFLYMFSFSEFFHDELCKEWWGSSKTPKVHCCWNSKLARFSGQNVLTPWPGDCTPRNIVYQNNQTYNTNRISQIGKAHCSSIYNKTY